MQKRTRYIELSGCPNPTARTVPAAGSPTIVEVSENRMAEMGQGGADLMQKAGLQINLH